MQFQFHVSILVNKNQSIVWNYYYKKNYKFNNFFFERMKILNNIFETQIV